MNYINLPDNILKLILKEMQNRQDEGDCDFDYEPFDVDCKQELNSICGYFGIELNDFTDKSFFVKLYKDNPNFETEPIKRPTLETYDVLHSESLREYKTQFYNTRMNSYYPLDKNIMYDLQSSGEYEYWEGSHFDTDYHDTEVTEDRVESIEKVKRR